MSITVAPGAPAGGEAPHGPSATHGIPEQRGTAESVDTLTGNPTDSTERRIADGSEQIAEQNSSIHTRDTPEKTSQSKDRRPGKVAVFAAFFTFVAAAAITGAVATQSASRRSGQQGATAPATAGPAPESTPTPTPETPAIPAEYPGDTEGDTPGEVLNSWLTTLNWAVNNPYTVNPDGINGIEVLERVLCVPQYGSATDDLRNQRERGVDGLIEVAQAMPYYIASGQAPEGTYLHVRFVKSSAKPAISKQYPDTRFGYRGKLVIEYWLNGKRIEGWNPAYVRNNVELEFQHDTFEPTDSVYRSVPYPKYGRELWRVVIFRDLK